MASTDGHSDPKARDRLPLNLTGDPVAGGSAELGRKTDVRASASRAPERPDGGAAAGRRRAVVGRGKSWRAFVMPALVVACVGIFSGLLPNSFMTTSNWQSMLAAESVVAILSLGVTMTLRIGDLDLSFAALAGTSGVLLAVLTAEHHMPVAIAVVITLGFGVFVGAVNALLIVALGLNSFVTTLGMMTVLEGVGYGISHSEVVSGVPTSLVNLLTDRVGPIEHAVLLGWILAVALWLVFEFTPFGRFLIFVGGNRDAARLAGLPVARVRATSYVVSAVLYSLAGVVITGTLGSVDPSISPQYLLPPLAAAFIGTTAIQPGRFNVVGTVVGLYLLIVISTGLQLLGAAAWVGDVFNGIALIVAITFARLVSGGSRSMASMLTH